ncbi:MAG TPA: SAM-dependent methyltransferase, partial [Solirubrobacteraceae bacterium]|nr:SAM-dependent methyltransferase [Solirubrobacteraceae bacterium]
MSGGRVLFVGCGPGAPDLLTVRAIRALETADIVIWSPSLLDRQALAGHTRPEAQIVEWPPATQRDVEAAFD